MDNEIINEAGVTVPETTEVLVDENGNPIDTIDYDAEVKKRGSKNIILENKEKAEKLREKTEKLKELEMELKITKEQLQNPQNKNINFTPIDDLENLRLKKIQRLKDRGEDTTDNIQEINDEIEIIRTSMKKAIEPQNNLLYEAQFDRALNDLRKDENAKDYMEVLENKLIEEVKKVIPKEHWGNRTVLEAVLGKLIINNKSLLQEKRKARVVTSSPNNVGSDTTIQSVINDKEFMKFVYNNNFSINSNEEIAIAKNAFKKYGAKK